MYYRFFFSDEYFMQHLTISLLTNFPCAAGLGRGKQPFRATYNGVMGCWKPRLTTTNFTPMGYRFVRDKQVVSPSSIMIGKRGASVIINPVSSCNQFFNAIHFVDFCFECSLDRKGRSEAAFGSRIPLISISHDWSDSTRNLKMKSKMMIAWTKCGHW